MNDLAFYNSCPNDEIAAYIDGELSPADELELDLHFAGCRTCSDELNNQKQFLCGLSSRLGNEGEIELPENFTKLIVANAESSVSGLRRPRERFNALFICAGLLLFVLFATGAEAEKAFSGISTIFEQMSAVGAFFGHLVYSILIGIVVVLRSFANQFRVDAVAVAFAAGLVAVLVMFVSRRYLRTRRT